MIRIAISSDESQKTASLCLLERMGIRLLSTHTGTRNQSANFPAEFLFVPENDIPALTAGGLVDLAVVGQHLIDETQADIDILRELNLGARKLAIVAALDNKKMPDNLNGGTIATALPNILAKHLKNNGLRAKIFATTSGQALVQTGLADLYFTCLTPNEVLTNSGLRLFSHVADSKLVLAANKHLSPLSKTFVDELLFRFDATHDAQSKKLVSMHIQNDYCDDILELLPSLQQPLVLPIDDNTSMLQTVMDEIRFWDIVEKLKELHATNIVLTPIGQIIH
ncbi:MAG: ATP phosphoribosyltransferase [Paludibacteraceae bacterium]